MNLANLSLTFKADISNANILNVSVVQTGLAYYACIQKFGQ